MSGPSGEPDAQAGSDADWYPTAKATGYIMYEPPILFVLGGMTGSVGILLVVNGFWPGLLSVAVGAASWVAACVKWRANRAISRPGVAGDCAPAGR